MPLKSVSHPASLSAPARQAAEAQQAAAAAAPAVGQKELTAQTWFEKGFNAADLDEKIRCYTEAIHLKPDFSEAYNNRGNARRRAKGDLDGALEDYAEAIRLKPDNAVAYNNRGNARWRAKGDLDGALKDYTEAIRLKPDNADAYYNRGYALAAKGDPASTKAAIADFQKYLDLGVGIREGDQTKVEQFIRELKKKQGFFMLQRNLGNSPADDRHPDKHRVQKNHRHIGQRSNPKRGRIGARE